MPLASAEARHKSSGHVAFIGAVGAVHWEQWKAVRHWGHHNAELAQELRSPAAPALEARGGEDTVTNIVAPTTAAIGSGLRTSPPSHPPSPLGRPPRLPARGPRGGQVRQGIGLSGGVRCGVTTAQFEAGDTAPQRDSAPSEVTADLRDVHNPETESLASLETADGEVFSGAQEVSEKSVSKQGTGAAMEVVGSPNAASGNTAEALQSGGADTGVIKKRRCWSRRQLRPKAGPVGATAGPGVQEAAVAAEPESEDGVGKSPRSQETRDSSDLRLDEHCLLPESQQDLKVQELRGLSELQPEVKRASSKSRLEEMLDDPTPNAQKCCTSMLQHADSSDWLVSPLPHAGSICGALARGRARQGVASLVSAAALLGPASPLLAWDVAYLARHLPAMQQFSVVRSFCDGFPSSRPKDSSVLREATFADFLLEADACRPGTDSLPSPLLDVHLLWKTRQTEHGFLGPVGDRLARDLRTLNLWMFKLWQLEDDHPLVQSCRLHIGLEGAEIPCEYSLQPRLLVQLSGRLAAALYPPEDWHFLYPFPAHSAFDGRSMAVNREWNRKRFPDLKLGKPQVAELRPGDALVVPPYWWLHGGVLGEESVLLSILFHRSGPRHPDTPYGVTGRCCEVRLARDIEEHVATSLAKSLAGLAGDPASAHELVELYMAHLKLRLSIPDVDDNSPPKSFSVPMKALQDVDVEVNEMVGARLMAQDPNVDPDRWLRRAVQGRF